MVVGAVQLAAARVDRARRRDLDVEDPVVEPLSLLPAVACVLRDVHAGRVAARTPDDALRIRRIDRDAVHHATRAGLVGKLLPVVASVGRLEHPAAGVPLLGIAVDAEVDDVGIRRISRDGAPVSLAPHRVGVRAVVGQALRLLERLPTVFGDDELDIEVVSGRPRGDGAYDVNPIGDMKVSEIYSMLEYLGAPQNIITKAPSAALEEGQTDEGEMGVTYAEIEAYMDGGRAAVSESAADIIERFHRVSEHKRVLPSIYGR